MPKTNEPTPEPEQIVKPTSNLFATLEETQEYLNVLLFGREGSGKTTCATTLANLEHGKVLVINAEGGLKKTALRNRGIDVSRIYLWPNDGQPITHGGLIDVYNQLKADLDNDPKSWAGVIIDSATELVPALIDQVAKDRMEKSARKGVVIEGIDEFFTDRSDYGTMSKMFRDILRKFRDLPTHFIITALERRDVDDDTGKVQYGPAVTPGVQADLLGYVDLVLACFAADEDKPYRALTRSAGKYRGKDRLGVLPTVLAEPTIPRILQYEDGTLTEENDGLQKGIK